MFQRPPQGRNPSPTFPHASGDVPTRRRVLWSRLCFSPREWGCSDVRGGYVPKFFLFPTRVGMFRHCSFQPSRALPFPHASGDVPSYKSIVEIATIFSPREWGCSEGEEIEIDDEELFPTRVGMFRRRAVSRPCWRPFPHASGDVPPGLTVAGVIINFSPREWGCSGSL